MINRRLLTKLVVMLFMVSSLSVLIAYGLPILLRAKILGLIEQQTSRKASLETLQVAVFPLSVQLQNFAIQEKNGKPFASFDRFYIKVDTWQSIKQGELVIDNVALVKPVVRIIKEKNAGYNVNSLFKTQTDSKQDTPLFPVAIEQLSLSEGKLLWEEPTIKETVQPINLNIEHFSTTAHKKCQLNLQLALDSGETLNWQGEAELKPLLANGHIELNRIKLPHLLAVSLSESPTFNLNGEAVFNSDYQISYTDQKLSITADKAKLELRDFQYSEKNQQAIAVKSPNLSYETDIKFHYTQKAWQFSVNNSKTKARDLQLAYANTTFKTPEIAVETALDIHQLGDKVLLNSKQGKINSRNTQLFDKTQDKPLIDIPDLMLSGIDFKLADNQLAIDSVSAKDADIKTWLERDGSLNYQTLFTPAKPTTPDTITAEINATPLAIKINNIALSNFATIFEDRSLSKPVSMTIKPIDFKLSDYSNKTGAKLPFQLNAGINKTGRIQINGNTIIEPFATDIAINANAIDIEPFQAYLEKIAHLDIIDGQLTTSGKLTANRIANQPLDLKFIGDSSISQFITRDQTLHKDFINWKNLSLKSLNVDLQKNIYSADTLIIDKLYTRVTIKKDKTINFSNVFITNPPASKAPAKASNLPPPYFKLAKVQIIDASSDFADNSLILPFSAQIKSLDGGASNISSDQKSTIKVSLKGNAYDLSPVDIEGNVSPYLGNYDLNLNFKGMPMPLISPYMVQFAGYKVEKGKLTLGLKYKVINDELTASNNILIDQFELGEKIDNPKAVSLPMELAVALLKDSDGKIKIDVPITGSLNNPQFDIGAIISDALTNAIGKVISSPFRALAAIVGDDDAEMSTISFSAGSAELTKAEQEKLSVLAKLLKQRPALMLDVKGTAFQTQDWSAMREVALYDHLKEIRANEINKQDSKKILPEYVKLSDSDYKRLLANLFIEKFPQLAKKSPLGTPELTETNAGDFYEVAKQKLASNLNFDQFRLKELAAQRARTIASYLVQKGGVANAQVFIVDPAVDPQRDNNEIASVLALKIN